jgi:hypothetical protein
VTDALPPIEEERREVKRSWLFVSDQEHPHTGCSGSCFAGQAYGNMRMATAPERPTLRRATKADLEALGCLRMPSLSERLIEVINEGSVDVPSAVILQVAEALAKAGR